MTIAIEAQRIFRPNKHGMDFVALETIRELQKRNEVVSKLWHNLFYAQSPDFRKPGLCYSPKFLYL